MATMLMSADPFPGRLQLLLQQQPQLQPGFAAVSASLRWCIGASVRRCDQQSAAGLSTADHGIA